MLLQFSEFRCMPLSSLRSRLCLLLAALSTAALAAPAVGSVPTLTAYTEQWPPYNFSEGGKVQGIATDVLRAACEQAQLRCNIDVAAQLRLFAGRAQYVGGDALHLAALAEVVGRPLLRVGRQGGDRADSRRRQGGGTEGGKQQAETRTQGRQGHAPEFRKL